MTSLPSGCPMTKAGPPRCSAAIEMAEGGGKGGGGGIGTRGFVRAREGRGGRGREGGNQPTNQANRPSTNEPTNQPTQPINHQQTSKHWHHTPRHSPYPNPCLKSLKCRGQAAQPPPTPNQPRNQPTHDTNQPNKSALVGGRHQSRGIALLTSTPTRTLASPTFSMVRPDGVNSNDFFAEPNQQNQPPNQLTNQPTTRPTNQTRRSITSPGQNQSSSGIVHLLPNPARTLLFSSSLLLPSPTRKSFLPSATFWTSLS